MKKIALLTVEVRYENDVVLARQRARSVAALLGFDEQEQVRVATAVSELARNAFRYAKGGRVEFSIEGASTPQVFVITVSDKGPGIRNLNEILAGRYKSETGMGLGLIGVRRLMDTFAIDTNENGTIVIARKIMRRTKLVAEREIAALTAELARQVPQNPFEEIQLQNQELIRTLEELRKRQEDLAHLNRELEDTNRGVVALYAELDEKADHLRRADELKSKFLSNMSHEFRTPLNSIMALSRLLIDRSDGDLNPEQEKQVKFIRTAANGLTELVNDLLDLAKVEAGKIDIKPAEFSVQDLFAVLRGMLKPLLVAESVKLVFEEPSDIPAMHTDEGKVSQILRNFISNSLKFTERGEVRVKAQLAENMTSVRFSVSDTGLGIAPEDHPRIFQEFTQVDNPMQRKFKGTGLGLPLSKKLAELLGGRITVESAPGAGSTFSVEIPIRYQQVEITVEEPIKIAEPGRIPVLVVEDSPETIHIYEKYLKYTIFDLYSAQTVEQARRAIRHSNPKAIILDVMLKVGETWELLADLKSDPVLREIPVLVVSMVNEPQKAFSLGASAYAIKPVEKNWLVDRLNLLTGQRPLRKILIIDDDEATRYILKNSFADPHNVLLEAQSGKEGLQLAQAELPHAIVLDLVMPDLSGFEVLAKLKENPATRSIPVIIHTSKVLQQDERAQLAHAFAIVSKNNSDQASDELWKALFKAGFPARDTTLDKSLMEVSS